jgi:hypothetical protein
MCELRFRVQLGVMRERARMSLDARCVRPENDRSARRTQPAGSAGPLLNRSVAVPPVHGPQRAVGMEPLWSLEVGDEALFALFARASPTGSAR